MLDLGGETERIYTPVYARLFCGCYVCALSNDWQLRYIPPHVSCAQNGAPDTTCTIRYPLHGSNAE